MSEPTLYKSESYGPVRVTRQILHETAAKFAEEQFALKGHAPFMWLLGCQTGIVWIETDWEDEREKEASLHFMRETAHTLGADCYACIAEAWVSVVPRAEVEGGRLVQPRNRPKDQREDILFIASGNRTGETGHSRWLVTQRRRGPNFLGPRVDIEDEAFTGRFFNILGKQA